MLNEIKGKLGLENIRGFEWPKGLGFSKSNESHFFRVHRLDGEIYVRNKGILTYADYHRLLIEAGFCLYIDGYIVAKEGYSDHFNALNKSTLGVRKREPQKAPYPVKEIGYAPMFEAAVQLFLKGVIKKDKLWNRVTQYINPEFHNSVFNEVVNHTPSR